MHTYILRFFLLFAASATNLSAQIPIYQNPDMPIEVRVEDALSRMTLEEKGGTLPCAEQVLIGRGAPFGYSRVVDE